MANKKLQGTSETLGDSVPLEQPINLDPRLTPSAPHPPPPRPSLAPGASPQKCEVSLRRLGLLYAC